MSTSKIIRVKETTHRALSELAEADAMFDAHNEAMGVGPKEQLAGTPMDGLDDDPWPLDEHGHPAR